MLIASPFSGDAGLDPKKIPGTKAELIEYVNNNTAPGINPKKDNGYYLLNTKNWMKSRRLFELHLLDGAFYEPYYMTDRYTQLYDETFIGWGYDKVTQVFDVRRLGYKLKVMPDAYMVHLNHKDIKDYKDWNSGFKQTPRYNMKVGTSMSRREVIPGFLTNTFYPEWLKNTKACPKRSSNKLNTLYKKIDLLNASTIRYKNILYGLMTVFAFVLIALIRTTKKYSD